jgi:PAS domain S-box-containing protein
MKPGKRFSRFIVWALILLEGISLTLVLGILFGILSNTMTWEFYNRIQGQQAEVNMILKDHLNQLETNLREISLNNTIRVSLMLGVKSQLLGVLEEQYPASDGAFFCVVEQEEGLFFPELPSDLWPLKSQLKKLSDADHLQTIQFGNFAGGMFLTISSNPIKRKDDRLGTAYLIYDVSRDKRFWARIGWTAHGRLLIRNEGYLVDLCTGEATPIPGGVWVFTSKDLEFPGMELNTRERLIPLRDFQGLYFAASSVPLHEKKTSLILTLAVLCAAVFLLTLLVSFLIGRKMSEPIENIADQALEIARKPSNLFLREEEIRYVEFRKLAQAFNQVLLGLLEAQEELKKRARREIDATEERYRLTVETAPDSITITRLADGRYLQVNEAFCRLSGYSREETLGRNPSDLNLFVNPSDNHLLVKILKETGEVNGMELQYRRKDGSLLDGLLSARPIRFGEQECLITVVTDISPRKKGEREKAALERKLRQAQKMEAIGTLAGGVAHDLNNILSGIVSYPELLLLDLPEDSHLRKPILTIKESGQKAATIVQDLLTLARRGVRVAEVINLNHIISEYLESPEHEKLSMFHPAVQVEADLEADLSNIVGSAVHLSKCIMNLLSNAAEAIPESGKILIRTENRHIEGSKRGNPDMEEGDYAALSVSDPGIGIRPEDLPRIFEPFYTKKVMGRSGTGLGLAVVWGTVIDHKGYVDVQSTEGEGSTFTLYFPATKRELDNSGSRTSIEDYLGRGESILVVDDVEEQRQIASGILKKLRYSVSTVSSGEEAVDYMKKNSVDLLILDMIMDPGMDGLETYRRIVELHPGQRAVIASGFSETERVKKAQRLGAGQYIRKPYTLEKIGTAVRTALDQ